MTEAIARDVLRLERPVDRRRDHVRGGDAAGAVTLVVYSDYLCPYCRRLRRVILKLRNALGDRLAYVYRHFPNERAHPGAEFLARAAEAASRQDRFWEMHDWLYEQQPPITPRQVLAFARSLGLDMERFHRDLVDPETDRRIRDDIEEGRVSGVTGTPAVFVDGLRYDGAWDFHSMLEALERPVGTLVERSARAFASLPASSGMLLIAAAAAALVCANTFVAPYYRSLIDSSFAVGPAAHLLSLSVGTWLSEGLLGLVFLLVGLEIRREMTVGALADPRAAILPVIAAVGGVLAPAAVYLILNSGPTAPGWSVPTATDVAFTLGILALLGDRIPAALRVFVATLAVVDDILSVLTLAIFYPHGFEPRWILAGLAVTAVLAALNRSRVYAAWPYTVATVALALFLHAGGVHAALAGVVLALFLPTRPAPAVAPLLAQAATALAELEHAESERTQAGMVASRAREQPIWEWASRNLSAASDRLLSPADRIERAVAPWSAYLILPLFAFSATGVNLHVDLGSPDARSILVGVILGLVVGKPLGITLASFLAIETRIARPPEDVSLGGFVGAACLCGIGDVMALLMADRAFADPAASAVAKIGVLLGSVLAALLGSGILAITSRTQPVTAAA